MNLVKSPVLIDKETNTIFRTGNLLQIIAEGSTYTGVLEQIKDVELTLDTSEQYDSSFSTLQYSQITSITKL